MEDKVSEKTKDFFEEFGIQVIEKLNKKEFDQVDFVTCLLGIYFGVLEQTTIFPKKSFDNIYHFYVKERKNEKNN